MKRGLPFLLLLFSAVIGQAAVSLQGTLAREYSLAPGEAFDGELLIRNSGSETESVRISQTDYLFAADGSNQFGPAGSTKRSNAGWLAAGTSLVNVPAGQTVSVPYHGRVPADAALQGSYWSMLMVENTNALDGTVRADGLKVLARYGVQIVTSIGDTGRRSVRFVKREVVSDPEGTPHLLVDVENDGERLVFPALWIELYDSTGAKLGRFGGKTVRLYPTCSARYRIDFPAIPKGTYKALMLADCGDDQIVGTAVSLHL